MTPSATETGAELKARGAFYTPRPVTEFLARWAIRKPDDRTLEPACGDGSFLEAAASRYDSLGRTDLSDVLVGVEKAPDEATKAARVAPTSDVRTASFFDVEPSDLGEPFDAVIGNPPYIRYHGFTGEDRAKGLARASAVGVQLTRLASSWAHFVVHATSFLTRDGRLALVLPAELLVTDYAQPVRAHLLARFSSVVVVAFDRMVFADAQVDAVLLLASNDAEGGLRFARLHDAADLEQLEVASESTTGIRPELRWSTSLDADADFAYQDLLATGKARRLADIGSIDIGVVTGSNGYFILTQDEATKRGLPTDLLRPIVQRPGDVKGLTVRDEERRLLLLIPPGEAPDDASLGKYLRAGKKKRVHQGYKCRVRRYWYSVPIPKKKPHAFLPYMTGDVPRLIVNESGALSTNLLHGLTLSEDAPDVRALSAAMLSSITAFSAEVEGRAYGGGVLKLETRESERLLVPTFSKEIEAALVRLHPELDALLRAGAGSLASRLVDAVVGIDSEPFERARLIFRTRRLDRGANPRAGANPT